MASTTREALERLCKWRVLFTGWQLGTRPKGDPESDAVRDHRELTILLRAEMSALRALLMEKGVISAQEFDAALGREAELLNRDYERRFPGVTATPIGLSFDASKAAQIHAWMRDWKP